MELPFTLSHFLPLLNGLVGDKFAQKKHQWAIPMSFRIGGEDISISGLGGKLKGENAIVLVHGLMADERVWKDLGPCLENSLSVFYIRYNSGLHISHNGKALAGLLNELSQRLGLRKLFLVGHSMGGLVIRSACYYGERNHHGWVKQVRAIFLIAVPNAGAALEKLGHLTSFTLRRIAKWYLGQVGNLLEQRSDGIKDLGVGYMVDEDWKSNKAKLLDHYQRTPVPPVPGIQYHILVGSLSSDEKSLMAKYFGDGLVTQGSAVGKTLLKVSDVRVFPKTGHNALLKSRKVHRYIKGVLGRFLK